MRTNTSNAGRRIVAIVVGATLAVLAGSVPSAAGTADYEEKLLELHNSARLDASVRPLRLDPDLSRVARKHSREMADAEEIFHTRERVLIRRLEPFDWSYAGENIGLASTVSRLHNAFMRSRPHRQNVLDKTFHTAGIGIVRRDGYLWVTVLLID